MKALDEYFLMVVFTLLQSRLHVFANFYVEFEQRKHGSERAKTKRQDRIGSLLLQILSFLQKDKNCPSDLPCIQSFDPSRKVKVLHIKPSTLWFSRQKEPLPSSCTRQDNASVTFASVYRMQLHLLLQLLLVRVRACARVCVCVCECFERFLNQSHPRM